MTAEITIAKGGTTVTIKTAEVSENYSNKISYIRPPQTKQKQDAGPVDVKVIDLLRITHELLIRGHIVATDSKTAKEIKEDLIGIFEGGGTTGGAAVVTYAGDAFNMFIEKMLIIEKGFDEPTTLTTDISKYDVQITCVEGVSI